MGIIHSEELLEDQETIPFGPFSSKFQPQGENLNQDFLMPPNLNWRASPVKHNLSEFSTPQMNRARRHLPLKHMASAENVLAPPQIYPEMSSVEKFKQTRCLQKKPSFSLSSGEQFEGQM
jgi:hypothetical protein